MTRALCITAALAFAMSCGTPSDMDAGTGGGSATGGGRGGGRGGGGGTTGGGTTGGGTTGGGTTGGGTTGGGATGGGFTTGGGSATGGGTTGGGATGGGTATGGGGATGGGSSDAGRDAGVDAGPPDADGDGVPDGMDNCPMFANPNQANHDTDPQGDACDNDDDNDLLADAMDNCPLVSNVNQLERDGDGIGDACDNCPLASNVDQLDSDNDMRGDACDNVACPAGSMDNCGMSESCNNGLDDNCNGLVDEGCTCVPGEVRSCFRGAPGRHNIGACFDGAMVCLGTQVWGPCTGGIAPSSETCDNSDNDCDGCVDNKLPACGTTALRCPTSSTVPVSVPFSSVAFNGATIFPGSVQSWQWQVSGGPCDELFLTTTTPPAQSFTLTGETTPSFSFKPTLSGDYTVRLTITPTMGAAMTCNFVARVAGPGLRTELCSDRTGDTDLDLHLHKSGTTSNWFTADDCHYGNCVAMSTGVGWGYNDGPLANCQNGPDGMNWTTLGYCRNPRLEFESISDNGVPENTNIDAPNAGETFRVAVHYWTGMQPVHPMVNVYCGGKRMASYGHPSFPVPNFDTAGASMGDFWKVVDVTTTGSGSSMSCTLAPLHPPGMPLGYWVVNNYGY